MQGVKTTLYSGEWIRKVLSKHCSAVRKCGYSRVVLKGEETVCAETSYSVSTRLSETKKMPYH